MVKKSASTRTPRLKKYPKRSELKPGEVLCDYCTARCCKYFALPIEIPEKRKDFDFLRWYLLHDGATLFTEDGDWYLLVHTTCKHLDESNRCGIYTTRPQICRTYTTDDCEYGDEYVYERYFETPEQVEEYVEATLPPPKGRGIRSAPPPLLPILS